MRGYCIVDRQYLYKVQVCFLRPVSQQFEIRKFANTKTILTSQAKDRDGNSRPFPGTVGEVNEAIMQDGDFIFFCIIMNQAVVSFFVDDEAGFPGIIHAVFVSGRKFIPRHVYLDGPPISVLPHKKRIVFVPVRQYIVASKQANHFILFQ